MDAFITGSRSYGKPNLLSDVDLVVRCSLETSDQLRQAAGAKVGEPVRFGKLNLIICTTDEQFAVWRLGTTEMTFSPDRPFNKDGAKAVLDQYRERVGMLDQADSGRSK